MDLAVGEEEPVEQVVEVEVASELLVAFPGVELVDDLLRGASHGLVERLLVADATVEVSGRRLPQDAFGDAVEIRATLVARAAEPPEDDLVLLLDALGSCRLAVGPVLLLLREGATLLGPRLEVGFISQLRRS